MHWTQSIYLSIYRSSLPLYSSVSLFVGSMFLSVSTFVFIAYLFALLAACLAVLLSAFLPVLSVCLSFFLSVPSTLRECDVNRKSERPGEPCHFATALFTKKNAAAQKLTRFLSAPHLFSLWDMTLGKHWLFQHVLQSRSSYCARMSIFRASLQPPLRYTELLEYGIYICRRDCLHGCLFD